MDTSQYFSNTYLGARTKFRKIVESKGGKLKSIDVDGEGADKEDLTIDIGYFGKDNPEYLFVHTSGVHGVEGFPGSAIQCNIIDNHLPDLPNNCGICFVHFVNPYGGSYYRRYNGNNVDLNRNFRNVFTNNDVSEVYNDLNEYLNPQQESFWWKGSFLLGAIVPSFKYSRDQLKQAIAGGQNAHPTGLFYIGNEMEPELEKLLLYLRINFQGAKRVTVLDVHTGLGDFGYDSLLVEDDEDDTFKNSLGDHLQTPEDENYVAYETIGTLGYGIKHSYPESEVFCVTQEFGTYMGESVLHCLRKENYYHTRRNVRDINHESKQKLFRIFNPLDDNWQYTVLLRGLEVFKTVSGFLHCAIEFE